MKCLLGPHYGATRRPCGEAVWRGPGGRLLSGRIRDGSDGLFPQPGFLAPEESAEAGSARVPQPSGSGGAAR
ncbi:hypothetical protein EYF80_020804 [Liparis tanakae]|uniref:Uncharacterized protein n=1 Tax=Liparis tanakae TaxID=230148 RepID=A0A4Z2HVE9_9TELE|nr:hypothetical protein EYF80_020804 [Liparis tanakae]